VFSALELSAVALWAKEEVNRRNAIGKEGLIKAVILHCLIGFIYVKKKVFQLDDKAFKALEDYIGKRKLVEKDTAASPSKRKKKEDKMEEVQSNSNI